MFNAELAECIRIESTLLSRTTRQFSEGFFKLTSFRSTLIQLLYHLRRNLSIAKIKYFIAELYFYCQRSMFFCILLKNNKKTIKKILTLLFFRSIIKSFIEEEPDLMNTESNSSLIKNEERLSEKL